MGFSTVSATAVMCIGILISAEIIFGVVFPELTSMNHVYHEVENRYVEQIEDDINITKISNVTWYNSNWLRRKPMCINHKKVDSDLKNFPVLINIVDDDLKKYKSSNGRDIIFTNLNGSIKYNHQIESYNSSNGHLVAFVNLTYINSTKDTYFFMYYNYTTVVIDSKFENPSGVWDSNFEGVWHLNESSGQIYDSTSNNNHGTKGGEATYNVSGKIAGAMYFPGTTGLVNMGNKASLNMGTDDFTIELWVKTQKNGYPISKYLYDTGTGFHFGYTLGIVNNKLKAYLGENRQNRALNLGTKTVTDNKWHHLVVVFDRSNMGTYYVDGNFDQETDISSWSTSVDTTQPFGLAIIQYGSFIYFNGTIDEPRITRGLRNHSWINTSYQNQNSPDTFIYVGQEEQEKKLHLDIEFKNTGSSTQKINYFNVLVNGSYNKINYVKPFAYPENYEHLFISVSTNGSKRVKIITNNGVSDYSGYKS